jgi:hypothetical protein
MVKVGCSCIRARRHRETSILSLCTGFDMTRSQSDREDQRRGTLRLLASLFFVASTVLLVGWLESGSTGARAAMAICTVAAIISWIGLPREEHEAVPDPPASQPSSIMPSVGVCVFAALMWGALVGPSTYFCIRLLSGATMYLACIGVTSMAGSLVGGLLVWRRPR